MRWLGQAQLINEPVEGYDSAIKQSIQTHWYHRLARWYVRAQARKGFDPLTQQLIGVFDEDEIGILLRFAGYGATAGGDEHMNGMSD